MKSYILYGLKGHDLTSAKEVVEHALSINLIEAESSYYGGIYYRLKNIGEQHFVLQKNLELDDELAEDDFPDYPILLYANEVQEPEDLEKLLFREEKDISLLKKEDL
jgi:hypothetical protein